MMAMNSRSLLSLPTYDITHLATDTGQRMRPNGRGWGQSDSKVVRPTARMSINASPASVKARDMLYVWVGVYYIPLPIEVCIVSPPTSSQPRCGVVPMGLEYVLDSTYLYMHGAAMCMTITTCCSITFQWLSSHLATRTANGRRF